MDYNYADHRLHTDKTTDSNYIVYSNYANISNFVQVPGFPVYSF